MVVAEIQAAGGAAPAFVITLNNPENAAIYDLGLPLVAANRSRGHQSDRGRGESEEDCPDIVDDSSKEEGPEERRRRRRWRRRLRSG